MTLQRLGKFIFALALLACTALLGVPSAQAIDQCHAPCLTAFDQCLANCLKTQGGTACTNQCSAQFNYCDQHTVCPPPGSPIQP